MPQLININPRLNPGLRRASCWQRAGQQVLQRLALMVILTLSLSPCPGAHRSSRGQRAGQQVLQRLALRGGVAREVGEVAAVGYLV